MDRANTGRIGAAPHLAPGMGAGEKREFFERMPGIPIPLDRGGLALRWMPKSGRVLDIGCGAGYHVRHFSRKSSHVAALDVDGTALALARRRVRSRRATFLRYDGERLPFADASFDTVTMLDVLEHVTDRAALVAEISRVLRPGGTCILSVPYQGAFHWLSPENLARDYPRAFRLLTRWTHVRFWIRQHNESGHRHSHFRTDDIVRLVGENFEVARIARRGSILYALAYLMLCFPLRVLKNSRLWTAVCFGCMAADYLIPYGAASYNLALELRRRPATAEIGEENPAIILRMGDRDQRALPEDDHRKAA